VRPFRKTARGVCATLRERSKHEKTRVSGLLWIFIEMYRIEMKIKDLVLIRLPKGESIALTRTIGLQLNTCNVVYALVITSL
jgi:hypothetical protein